MANSVMVNASNAMGNATDSAKTAREMQMGKVGTDVDAAVAKAANGAAAKAAVDLDMRVTLVDGDEVIADTTEEGDFLAACKKFEGHIRQRFPRAAAA